MVSARALLVDLDDTLIDTRQIGRLREAGKWKECLQRKHLTTCFRGIANALDRARIQGWKIAIVTNSPQVYTDEMLRHHCLPHDTRVSYHCVQHNKPHGEYVNLALQRLGCKLGRAIGLGDSMKDLGSFNLGRIPNIGAGWSPVLERKDKWDRIASSPSHLLEILSDPQLDLSEKPRKQFVFPAERTRMTPDDLKQRKFLHQDDKIFYLVDYESGSDFSTDTAAQFFTNLKKDPDRFRGQASWKYKAAAIKQAAAALRRVASFDFPVTYVPLPPSKAKDHPSHDDRVLQILRAANREWDVRELIVQAASRDAYHNAPGEQRNPLALMASWTLDESQLDEIAPHVLLVDDVVTKGTHYRAAANLLHSKLPHLIIAGLFLARAVFPPDDFTVDLSEWFAQIDALNEGR